ncbi:hypothetical protein [Oceanicoccus sp. KOV_DT_Chl]|nr:hypothetical protein [Oceanicoccus sp. KOV_DT_Chl]
MSTSKYRGVAKKPPCKHCIRARWILTVLILATMLVVLYLDQSAA